MIQTKQGKYYVEPAYHPEKTITPGHKHLIFKRSAVINSIDPITSKTKNKKRKRKKNHQHNSNCGTREPKRWTE